MIVANREKIAEMAENMANLDHVKGRSLWADARRRFMHNKAAVVSLFILTVIVAFSFIGPSFAVWSNEEIDWNTMGSAATAPITTRTSGSWSTSCASASIS